MAERSQVGLDRRRIGWVAAQPSLDVVHRPLDVAVGVARTLPHAVLNVEPADCQTECTRRARLPRLPASAPPLVRIGIRDQCLESIGLGGVVIRRPNSQRTPAPGERHERQQEETRCESLDSVRHSWLLGLVSTTCLLPRGP